MSGILRKLAIGGGAATLVVAGAAAAQAATWTWASSSSPIVMTGGGGYGSLDLGSQTVNLNSALRDSTIGDGRVYAKVGIYNSRGLYTNLTSGQRSDGESSYAWMADKSVTLPQLMGNYDFAVRTCRAVTLQDPCSTDTRRY